MANRLAQSSSLYLRQHQNNPVEWYPWGREAFEEAERSGRPILLSIGYSTCHWCHVMAHESFEDRALAEVMNRLYVAIKVDREERPDVDAIYMSAVQLLHGHGGWPMTVWLLPDGRPYFAATYLPPNDRPPSAGFRSLLVQLRELYDHDRPRVEKAAESLAAGVREALSEPLHGEVDNATVSRALTFYAQHFDRLHGGLGGAPKFPSSLPVRLLHAHGGDEALQMAKMTLEHMARGGMYDQLAGGFHRYSTDAHWLVPHFEKMLYDNALLALAYLEGSQVHREPSFGDVCREVLDYVLREMSAADGGFFSATDADSETPSGEHEEGYCFAWTPSEIESALGKADGERFCRVYGVTERGNFEGRNVLSLVAPEDRLALGALREKLLAVRLTRPQPARDERRLASWNGLMIAAMARAGVALAEPRYVSAAVRAGELVFSAMMRDGSLLRSPGGDFGFLDDHANVIAGCLALFSATADGRWLDRAMALQATLDRDFWDNGYFVSSARHEALLVREKPSYDGAEPCGNAICALNLIQLYDWTTDDRYRQRLQALFAAFGGVLDRAPQALAHMVLALQQWQQPSREVVVVGSDELGRVAHGRYLPRSSVLVGNASQIEALKARVPWLEGKTAAGKAYVCTARTCLAPISEPKELEVALGGGER